MTKHRSQKGVCQSCRWAIAVPGAWHDRVVICGDTISEDYQHLVTPEHGCRRWEPRPLLINLARTPANTALIYQVDPQSGAVVRRAEETGGIVSKVV